MTDTWIPPDDLRAWALESLKRTDLLIRGHERGLETESETINQLLTMKSIRDDLEADPLLRAWVLVMDVKGETLNAAMKDATAGREYSHHRIEQLNKLRAIIELGLKS